VTANRLWDLRGDVLARSVADQARKTGRPREWAPLRQGSKGKVAHDTCADQRAHASIDLDYRLQLPDGFGIIGMVNFAHGDVFCCPPSSL
jgi:hypothetical protein